MKKEIPYFEGINAHVASNISKVTEFMHAENARSKNIGTVEKREGQKQIGEDFVSTDNLSIFHFNSLGKKNSYVNLTEVRPVGDINSDWNCLACNGDGSKVIAGISPGRLYRSVDYGANWVEIRPAGNNNIGWESLASSTDGTILMAGSTNKLYLSTDSGTTWAETQPAGAVIRDWKAVACSGSGSVMIAAISGTRIYVSVTAGAAWTEVTPAGATNKYWRAVHCTVNGTTLLAAVNGGRIYRSTDSGVNWTEIQPIGNLNASWTCLASSTSGSRIYAGIGLGTGLFGRLYKSSNGGVSWAEIRPAGNTDQNWRCLSCDSTGYDILAGTIGNRIYNSEDAGVTWEEIQPAGNHDEYWTSVVFPTVSAIRYACSSSGLGIGRVYQGPTWWNGAEYTAITKGLYRTSYNGVGDFVVYYLGVNDIWTGISQTNPIYSSYTDRFSTCTADTNLYITSKDIHPFYLGYDGVTPYSTYYYNDMLLRGNLYQCFRGASLINYYKSKLYVANYIPFGSSTRMPNQVFMSSLPLGLIALVGGDTPAGSNSLPITDFKYFKVGDKLEVWRGFTEVTQSVVKILPLNGAGTDPSVVVYSSQVIIGTTTFTLSSYTTVTDFIDAINSTIGTNYVASLANNSKVISLKPISTITSPSVTVDNVQITVGTNGGPVFFGYALYPTLNALVAAINADAHYVATYDDTAFASYPTADLFYTGSSGSLPLVADSTTAFHILSKTSPSSFASPVGFFAVGSIAAGSDGTFSLMATQAPINLITVAGVSESSLTLSSPTIADINASDELWIPGTKTGELPKIYRWATFMDSGIKAKDYDTFKLASTTDNDNEEIKLLTNIGNVMLIGSNNNLAIWNNYVLQYLDMGVGCVSKNGYVKCLGAIYLLHYSGIFKTQGGLPEVISEKVEKYITGATTSGLENACAGKRDKCVFFCIGDVTIRLPDGSIEKQLKDVCLEFNIIHQTWYVHTNIKADQMTTFINSDNPDTLAIISHDDGNPVYDFLSPEFFSDGTKEIPFRVDTNNLPISASPEKFGYLLEVLIEMERGMGLKTFPSLDFGPFYECDTDAAKGLTIVKANRKALDGAAPPRCRNVRVSFRHTGKGGCRLSKVAINYIISAEEEVKREEEYYTSPYENAE